ncbi:MAG: uracil-DNA glycosylase family protein [Rhizobiaceae bacterium]|nr:uracil-DNA glycosylase family protein [Rhizobiaceae bacterium]
MSPELAALAGRIRACRICVETPRGRPLPHEPRPVVVPSQTARILIAGQAPGTKVQASGVPFDDASGDRLRDWLGVGRAQFYDPDNFAIVPMGFCFPGQDGKGGDLPPRRECAPAWRAPLIELMPQVDLVLAIGLYAQAWHMGAGRQPTLTETVASWRRSLDTPDRGILPLPHPSWRNSGWLKRNPWFETELLPVLRRETAVRLKRI